MSDRLCVIAGCRQLGAHRDRCTDDKCRGCRPRLVEWPLVCNADRPRLGSELREIGGLWPDLLEEVDPVDGTEWMATQLRPIPTADPTVWAPVQWVAEAGSEELARVLPMGVTRRSLHGRVSGTPDPSAPADLDLMDLVAKPEPYSLDVRFGRFRGDQVGHLAIASELLFWVDDWIRTRAKGESMPAPTVPTMVGWLAERLSWACDEHLAIDEFAVKIRGIRAAMRGQLGLVDPRPERMAAPCPGCDLFSLERPPGEDDVECGNEDCRRVLRADEYERWARMVIAGERAA